MKKYLSFIEKPCSFTACLFLIFVLLLLNSCASIPTTKRAINPNYKRLVVSVVQPEVKGADTKLFEDAVERLVRTFGKVNLFKDIKEAKKSPADLVATFSIEAERATNIFGTAIIRIRVNFTDSSGSLVESLQAYGRQMGRPPLLTPDLNNKARQLALLDLEGKLSGSAALGQYATSLIASSLTTARQQSMSMGTKESEVDEPLYHLKENSSKFAVVIGIENYSGLPPATFAQADAASVRRHLMALGYPERNIISLTDTAATRGAIQGYIEEWLPKNVTPDSTVLFYYSGHGAPEPKSGQAYLVPWDGNPQFLQSTAYPVRKLYESLSALSARNVLIFLDACFSGAGGRSVLAQGTRPLVSKIDTGIIGNQKLISFSASKEDEISGTVEDQGHGAFTYYFLKGLNGAAADKNGNVTIKVLYDYILPNVQDAARRQNRDQTPQLMPANLGEQSSIKLR